MTIIFNSTETNYIKLILNLTKNVFTNTELRWLSSIAPRPTPGSFKNSRQPTWWYMCPTMTATCVIHVYFSYMCSLDLGINLTDDYAWPVFTIVLFLFWVGICMFLRFYPCDFWFQLKLLLLLFILEFQNYHHWIQKVLFLNYSSLHCHCWHYPPL